jgi:hypothetical protein
MALNSDVTDRVVAAMRASGRGFSDLAEMLGLDEIEIAEIVYRHRTANSAAADKLSAGLGQPAGSFDSLQTEPRPETGSKFVAFLKWTFEQVGSGLIVAISIFVIQQNYLSRQSQLSKAAAEASAVSSHISTQSTSLIKDFRAYLSIADQITSSGEKNANTRRELRDQLETTERSLLVSLRVIEPFAPGLNGSTNGETFEKTVRQTTRDILATGEFESFDLLSAQFADVIKATQIDLRQAVKAEFDQVERKSNDIF